MKNKPKPRPAVPAAKKKTTKGAAKASSLRAYDGGNYGARAERKRREKESES